MTNLLTATPTSIAALENRSRASCVVYRNHPLPTGVTPPSNDIGIEACGVFTLLHVKRGLAYDGDDPEVRNWIDIGTRAFPTLADCISWVRARVHQSQEPRPVAEQPTATRLPADQVTDLDAINVASPLALTTRDLEDTLAAQILGQDSAVHGLAELAAHHVAKPYPRRPATALLIGATGTGKTLAAEQLAQYLTRSTGSEWSYQRLDMNEFSEQYSAARLFGAPPGYIGYDDGHDLAATLRANPRTVVVLDEIDKAHPQLWRSLMNLMDAGRLGSLAGDIDARQAILIFTSNKDAAAIQPLADAPETQLRAFLRDHDYPPEIIGRIGRILVFKPLSSDIRTKLIILTVQRVTESWGLRLVHIDPGAVASLANRAPSHTGGRDVEYFVERELSDQLADARGPGRAITVDKEMTVHVKPPTDAAGD